MDKCNERRKMRKNQEKAPDSTDKLEAEAPKLIPGEKYRTRLISQKQEAPKLIPIELSDSTDKSEAGGSQADSPEQDPVLNVVYLSSSDLLPYYSTLF